MKLFFCLTSCFLLAQLTTVGQWYSYDGFEKKPLNASQVFAIAHKNFLNAGIDSPRLPNRITSRSVKKCISDNLGSFKKKLDSVRKERMQNIAAVNASIIQKEKLLDTAKNEEVKKQLNEEISTLKEQQDELTKSPELNILLAQKVQELRYLYKRLPGVRLVPVTSRMAAESYFENNDTLVHESDDDGVFSFEFAYLNYLTQSNRLGFFVEPLSDYIGPVRLSLGLLVLAPAAKDSADNNATGDAKTVKDSVNNQQAFADRFKSSGGYASLNASFPLFQAHDAQNYLDVKSYLSPRLCIDVPKENKPVQRFAFHTQLGVETQVKVKTFSDAFNVLLCHRYARILGNSTFYDNMGFKNGDHKSFNFTTWTVGFIAKRKLAVYYTWYTGKTMVTEKMNNNKSLTANIQL